MGKKNETFDGMSTEFGDDIIHPGAAPGGGAGHGERNFVAMAVCYAMGVFNDNFFRQATLLLAVVAGKNWYPGTAMALFALPYLLFSAPAGWLADRFPKRNVVVGAKTLECAAMICGALGVVLGSWALMLAMVCLMGTQSAIFNPALNGAIPELFPAREVNRINARLRVAVTGAILLGVACAGLALNVRGELWGMRAGRLAVGGVVLVVAAGGLLASFGVPHRKAAAPGAAFPWTGAWDTIKELWRIRRDPLLTLAIGLIVLVFFLGAVKILIVNEMGIEQYGLGEAATSGMIFTAMTGVAVGGLASSKIIKRISWHSMMMPLGLGMGAVFCLLAYVSFLPQTAQLPAIFVLLGFAGILGGLMVIPAQAFLQLRPRPERRGAVIAACNFAVFSGILLSGPAGWGMLRIARPTATFSMLAALSMAAVFILSQRGFLGSIFNRLLALIARLLLRLRYRIELKGLDAIEKRGRSGVVFLPNHPALIDPVILLSLLYPRFDIRTWAVEHQVDRPVVRWLARRLHVRTFPAVGREPGKAREKVHQHIKETAAELEEGKNFLIYPSGHAYRTGREDLRGNSAAHRVLSLAPGARAVMVRTTGLWGSSFSWAYGHAPRVGSIIREAIKDTMLNLVFLTPRRRVCIEFAEPEDLPVDAGREQLNRYLEDFYNRGRHRPLYVPYTIWERGGTRHMPEPQAESGEEIEDIGRVPEDIRDRIADHLQEVSGVEEINPAHFLGRDLGIDSLGRAELLSWIESEWGESGGNAESVRTVADLMLAASGYAPGDEPEELPEPPAKWFREPKDPEKRRIGIPESDTLTDAFLNVAVENPDSPVLADQVSGLLSFRRVLTAVFALRPHIEKLPGRRIGIMLPASAGAGVVYLATLFAGKTPVMLNWTLGSRNLLHCLNTAEVKNILTARALTARVEKMGTDLSGVSEYFTYLSDLRANIGPAAKISAALHARLRPRKLLDRKVDPLNEAVILFTSGSESFPKAVPLTHANILSNLQDITEVITLHPHDRLLGMLPPFHSFGLTVTLLLPLCTGMRTVFHPDPTDGGTLSQLIDLYGVKLLVGTPTFLHGILNSRAHASLSTLRLAVTGAEKCTEEVYDALSKRCPEAVVLEGYGITECSPVVSVNDENAPRRQSIGKVLPSLDYAIVDTDSWRRVETGERGMLLLRGPSVFGGYLPENGKPRDPFVEFEGLKWYETGDLVSEDSEGVLTFQGRLKRFVKIGGEMISLPAIEEVLQKRYPGGEDGPAVAVDALEEGGSVRIVLFTTCRDIDRRAANNRLRDAGLSALYNIKRVCYVDSIPVLGTGKTDYRKLKQSLPKDRAEREEDT